MHKEVHVKSSSSDSIYCVTFELEGNTLEIHCDCQAGSYGKICKHKLNLLEGATSNLVDLKEFNNISEILSKVNNSDFAAYNSSIKKIDNEIKRLNSEKKKLKKELEQMLFNGFEV